VREYVDRLYVPAAGRYLTRATGGALQAVRLCRWRETLDAHWRKLHFGRLSVNTEGEYHCVMVEAYLDELDSTAVQVQLYADPQDSEAPEVIVMDVSSAAGTPNSYICRARVPARRPALDYTPRIVPYLDGIAVPLETAHILWYES